MTSSTTTRDQDKHIEQALAAAAKKEAAKQWKNQEQDQHVARALAEVAQKQGEKHRATQKRTSWLGRRRNSASTSPVNHKKVSTASYNGSGLTSRSNKSNSSSSDNSTSKSNKMSTTMAQRKHGVCQGCLYRSTMNIADGTSSTASYEYCVLVGVQFSCYESYSGWEKGQPPIASYTIVGSSMANSTTPSRRGRRGSKNTATTNIETSFRLVTNQGTHLTCQVPTTNCRDIWLHALSSGLEGSLLSTTGDDDTTITPASRPILSKVKPRHKPASDKFSTQKYCASCGKVERWEFPLQQLCRPLVQHGYESRQDLCYKCETAQGVLDHCYYMEDLYASSEQERSVLLKARALIVKEIHPNYPMTVDEPVSISLTPLSHHVLERCLNSPAYITYCRTSPTLEDLKLQFSQGLIGVLEFLEHLESALGIADKQLGMLKTQAFRAAGDMGTALKLLYETCHSPTHDMELLQSILEFFLDLLQEDSDASDDENGGYGELKTLAFFWPQICTIHLQLLPPTNAKALKQVEMIEDFLLTVASQYSVHLAIELIWCHVADLEDSRSLPYCLKRKYCVLRFICELESLLFDFDSGWGGGSVTVGQFLSPSTHQMECMKSAMQSIQKYRMLSHHPHLSRSRRLTKLRKARQQEQNENKSNTSTEPEHENPELMAQEALRIASNADYLSSHLAFTKRLCDIAEKLRFEDDVSKRPAVLRKELSKLNSSGAMGGDPLNIVKASSWSNDSTLSRVIRIPMNEGHVFRSKERTPVLLLVEINDEGADKTISKHKQITAFPKHLPAADEEEEIEETKVEKEEIKVKDEGSADGSEVKATKEDFSDNGLSREAVVKEDDEEKKDNGGSKDEDEANASAKETKVEEEKDGDMSISSSKEEGKTNAAETSEKAGDKEPKETAIKQEETSQKDDSIYTGETAAEANGGNDSKGHNSLNDDADVADGNGDDPLVTPTGAIVEGVQGSEDAGSAGTPVNKPNYVASSEDRKVTLSCSLEGLDDENTTSRGSHHALRRFDSPKREPTVVTPCANKETVEALVSDVVAKQLHIPTLQSVHMPDLQNTNEKEAPDDKDSQHQSLEDEADYNGEEKETQPVDPVKTSKLSGLVGKTAGGETNNSLSRTGDTRRAVLTEIMKKGMSGSHTIAEGAATAAQRHLQDLERRRAVELLSTGDDPTKETNNDGNPKSDRQELLSLVFRSASRDDLEGELSGLSEDDEVMEAIRLLLIQYQVAQGGLSLNDAAAVLAPQQSLKDINKRKSKEGTMIHFGKEFPEIQAGDIDDRLIGCGVLPPAVLQALTLWKANMITNGELLELVKKDLEFVKISSEMESSVTKLNENSAFWGRFAFGERWAEKRSRIAASSPEATQPGWDLIGIIVKSNDDLRQEAFVMQLIELCKEAFQEAGLELWLLPYRILSTGRTTGIIEMVRNAMSIDALKKRPGYGTGGLRDHLLRMTQFAADPSEAYKTAQKNFVRSLAAYSLLSYLFLFKDRHNGNILLDTAGHVIHIDFGFVFGIAPGGSFSLEMSTPFKLTEEMIEVMDGLRSSHFSEFVTLFCCGFLALQAHSDTFLTLVEITCKGSTFKCFEGRKSAEVVEEMKDRLRPELDKEQSIAFCLDIIKESTQSYGTAQYDYFQYLSQGIAT